MVELEAKGVSVALVQERDENDWGQDGAGVDKDKWGEGSSHI